MNSRDSLDGLRFVVIDDPEVASKLILAPRQLPDPPEDLLQYCGVMEISNASEPL